MREKMYAEVRNHSFRLALFMLKDHDIAEDIAQVISLKFLLNEDKIEKHLPWTTKCTKNEVYSYCKKRKVQEINIPKGMIENIANDSAVAEEIGFNNLPSSEEQVKRLLSKEDFLTYRRYIRCSGKTSIYSRKYKLSYHTASSKVYKMKRNLKANYLKSIGYLGSKNIVSYSTNKNIVNFINSFIKKINKGELKTLKNYFSDFVWEDLGPIKMRQSGDYEIRLISPHYYKFVVPYKDCNDEHQLCIFQFSINKRNMIKIQDLHLKTKERIKVKISKEELMKLLPKEVNGIIPNTYDDVLKLLKEYNEKKSEVILDSF